jgi:hypothetical protein
MSLEISYGPSGGLLSLGKALRYAPEFTSFFGGVNCQGDYASVSWPNNAVISHHHAVCTLNMGTCSFSLSLVSPVLSNRRTASLYHDRGNDGAARCDAPSAVAALF